MPALLIAAPRGGAVEFQRGVGTSEEEEEVLEVENVAVRGFEFGGFPVAPNRPK